MTQTQKEKSSPEHHSRQICCANVYTKHF